MRVWHRPYWWFHRATIVYSTASVTIRESKRSSEKGSVAVHSWEPTIFSDRLIERSRLLHLTLSCACEHPRYTSVDCCQAQEVINIALISSSDSNFQPLQGHLACEWLPTMKFLSTVYAVCLMNTLHVRPTGSITISRNWTHETKNVRLYMTRPVYHVNKQTQRHWNVVVTSAALLYSPIADLRKRRCL
jgi:hypothetical protein